MESLIKIKDVCKEYKILGKRQQILQGIDFEVQKGEFLCIVGASGCGKSTLLRIITGLIPATSGSVDIDPKLRLSMVFQNFALFPWLTVEENIGYGLLMKGEKKSVIKSKVSKLVRQMGLLGVETKHPKELSGGMKQRVGIARALAIEPDVLLLDEPFSALDVFTAKKLREDLLSIWQENNLTVIMVSHLIEEAVQLADKIVVMSANPGEVKSIQEIGLSRPRGTRSAEFFEYADKIEALVTAQ